MMTERVTDNPARERYEIHEDGELAGFVRYRRSGSVITFIHTQTDQRFRGRGVAARLVAASLDDVRKKGLDMLPFCPFVRDWLADHPEYADLVPEPDRAAFGLRAGR
jgi:uncharacterized protein